MTVGRAMVSGSFRPVALACSQPVAESGVSKSLRESLHWGASRTARFFKAFLGNSPERTRVKFSAGSVDHSWSRER
jgi:hypothetical protein